MTTAGRLGRAATIPLALLVYALLWIGWSAQWSWLARADHAALDAAYRIGSTHSVWVTAWDVLCTVFSPGTIRMVVVGLVLWLALRREWRRTAFLVVTVELTAVVTSLAKHAAHRPRPSTALVHESGSSFPSGHALGTIAAILALLTLAMPLVRRGARIPLVVLGGAIVLAVGVGRVALNVHHPSDVVAGWLLGYAWCAAATVLLPRVNPSGTTRPAPGTAP